MAKIDCFEHFRQPSGREAAPLCYPPTAPSGQMQQCPSTCSSMPMSSSPSRRPAGCRRSMAALPLRRRPASLARSGARGTLTTPRPAGSGASRSSWLAHQSWSEQGNWWIAQDAASIALDLPAKEAKLRALVAAVFPPVCRPPWRRLEPGQARGQAACSRFRQTAGMEAPSAPPVPRPLMHHRWTAVTFLHWPFPP